ncbi:MAG: very short patch repair endonuclease [Proteobacteria bacterium]|nr:very short patch repair endonuclease [Pseudomonadota bacterium]
MVDHLEVAERSALMSRVRSRGNASTEVALARLMRRSKISGWRRNQKIFGSPDFVFRAPRIAVFVDGCFWHGCPRCYATPKQNALFWTAKISRNRSRDLKVTRHLRKEGWSVLRIWEHSMSDTEIVIGKILRKLTNRIDR